MGDCVQRLQEEILPGLNAARENPLRLRINVEIGREMSRLDPFYVPSTPVTEDNVQDEEEEEGEKEKERERVNPFSSLFSSSSSHSVKLTGSLQFSFITEEAEGREEDARYKIGFHLIRSPGEDLKVKRA